MNELYMQTVDMIREMPRDVFRERVFQGIAKTKRFSELVTFGAESLPEAEREQIWLALREAGIRIPCEKIRRQPEALEAVAAAITARAVALR